MKTDSPLPPAEAVTGLLQAWSKGDVHARDELMPMVYAELRRRAAAHLRRERPDHTLRPTDLLHDTLVMNADGRGVTALPIGIEPHW